MNDIADSVQNLIDSGKGDYGRLVHILNSVKSGKKLFSSDQKYLDNLLDDFEKESKSKPHVVSPPTKEFTTKEIQQPESNPPSELEPKEIQQPESTPAESELKKLLSTVENSSSKKNTAFQYTTKKPREKGKKQSVFTIVGIISMIIMGSFVIGMIVYVIPLIENDQEIIIQEDDTSIPDLDSLVSRGISYCSEHQDESCDAVMLQWYAECNGVLKEYSLTSCLDGRISIYLVTRGLAG